MKKIILPLLIGFTATTALADLQITSIDDERVSSTFSSNGKTARIDNAQDNTYALINLNTYEFKMVDPQRREVMIMGAPGSMQGQGARIDNLNVSVKKLGNGPSIAGYSTIKYQLLANNKNCGTIFGSRKLMKEKSINQLFEAMLQFQKQASSMMGGFQGMMGECERADMKASELYPTTGVPLRMLDQYGQLESEVTRINTKAKVAASHYANPKGFQVVSIQDKMNEAQQQTQQMMQNMPDMDKLMQQMQQDGRMPPDMMQKMQEMQEMFKNQFQQQ